MVGARRARLLSALSGASRVHKMPCWWVSVPLRAAQLGFFFLIRRHCCLGAIRAGFQTHGPLLWIHYCLLVCVHK